MTYSNPFREFEGLEVTGVDIFTLWSPERRKGLVVFFVRYLLFHTLSRNLRFFTIYMVHVHLIAVVESRRVSVSPVRDKVREDGLLNYDS